MNHPLKINPVMPAHKRFDDEYVHNIGLKFLLLFFRRLDLNGCIKPPGISVFPGAQGHEPGRRRSAAEVESFPTEEMQTVLKAL